MYGRLRAVAAVLQGRVGQFVSVGGVPAYRGFMNPWLHEPNGLPVPIAEDAPTVQEPAEDEKGYRIARTEERVFDLHPDAAHFRYPYVYGPYQLVPREWLVVRRVLDGRRRIVVADDGLTLHHHGYTENLAHALLLAFEQPDAAAGKVFNVGDEEVLSVRQVVEVDRRPRSVHELEIVSMPYDLAVPARPLQAQPLPTHRVLDLTRLRSRPRVPRPRARSRGAGPHRALVGGAPARARVRRRSGCSPTRSTTRPRTGSSTPGTQRARACPSIAFASEPGYGMAYSGPGGRPRTATDFDA